MGNQQGKAPEDLPESWKQKRPHKRLQVYNVASLVLLPLEASAEKRELAPAETLSTTASEKILHLALAACSASSVAMTLGPARAVMLASSFRGHVTNRKKQGTKPAAPVEACGAGRSLHVSGPQLPGVGPHQSRASPLRASLNSLGPWRGSLKPTGLATQCTRGNAIHVTFSRPETVAPQGFATLGHTAHVSAVRATQLEQAGMGTNDG